MSEYIHAYEYESNVNPNLNQIPISTKNIMDCGYGINFIDFSEIYNVKYKSTTPNLLASFIKIKPNSHYHFLSQGYTNASSHLFYIMQGKCNIINSEEKDNNDSFYLDKGDLFISPYFQAITIMNTGKTDVTIYYINDSPLLNYLGAIPKKETFKAAVYSKDFLLSNLEEKSNPKNNRKGILLSNDDTEKIGVNTITPVLWSLYNELPPNIIQRPHKHNSVALDLCILCSDTENIYTLIGDELDEDGNIINPTKVNWKQNEMFITPPGMWHSHHNTGNTYAYILPIQDAGLLLYQRILGIVLK
jgi:gentisate 1,2-dioxygenase